MIATARSELAHLYRHENRLDEALYLYHQTIISWQEQGHLSAVTHQLECFAYLSIALGQFNRAARLLGAAGQARQRLNALSTEPQELSDLEMAMTHLAEVMGQTERDTCLEAVLLVLEVKAPANVAFPLHVPQISQEIP